MNRPTAVAFLLFVAFLALPVASEQTEIDEVIPSCSCIYYGPYNASIYDMNYTISIYPNDTMAAVDILFVHNNSDPRTVLDDCAVVSSDIFMEPSLVGAVDEASFVQSTVTFSDAFWILIRNANPLSDNITVHVVGYVVLVESPLTTFTQNWIYFVAAAAALVALIVGAVLVKCGCSRCGNAATNRSIAMKRVGRV